MRTLFEIIESAQDGNMPTHEECYWAMLALNSLDNLNRKRLMDLSNDVIQEKKTIKMRAEFAKKGCFDSVKSALGMPPKNWLGPSHDPSTEECQSFRKMAKGILSHVIKNMESRNETQP